MADLLHNTSLDTGFESDNSLSISSDNESSANDLDTSKEQSSWEIPPPPENQYDSLDLAHKAIHTWTREHKFELVRKKTFKRKEDNTLYGYLYKCGKWGKTLNTRKLASTQRKRLTRSSKSTGCCMSLHLCAVDGKDTKGKWEITHQQNGKSLYHNHPPAYSAVGLANHRSRARTKGQMDRIKEAHLACIPAGPTTAMLQNEEDITESLYTLKDINNMRHKLRREELQGNTVVEAMIRELKKDKYFFVHEINSDNRLTKLFYAHPQSIADFKDNCDIIMMDNTFKTNRYNVPVADIIGVTGMNTTIQLGFAFLPFQDQFSYSWLLEQMKELFQKYAVQTPSVFVTDREQACLNALEEVFPDIPSLICRWHMNKDVKAYCRRKYGMIANSQYNTTGNNVNNQQKYLDQPLTQEAEALYHQAVESTTEDAFESTCQQIREKHPQIGAYLDSTWWPYKQRIVKAWTDKITHFGQQSTSRVEGWHVSLKRWLKSSRCDLLTFFNATREWLKLCQREYNAAKGKESNAAAYCFTSNDLYSQVVGKVFTYGFNETHAQYQKAMTEWKNERDGTEVRSICTDSYSTIKGLPCKHRIMTILDRRALEEIGEPFEGSTALAMTDFDVHYWIYRNPKDISETRQQRVREFRTQRRIKPSNATNKRRGAGLGGTHREPLMSERIDLNHRATPPQEINTSVLISNSANTQTLQSQEANPPASTVLQPKRHRKQPLPGTSVFSVQSLATSTISSTQPRQPYPQTHTQQYHSPYSRLSSTQLHSSQSPFPLNHSQYCVQQQATRSLKESSNPAVEAELYDHESRSVNENTSLPEGEHAAKASTSNMDSDDDASSDSDGSELRAQWAISEDPDIAQLTCYINQNKDWNGMFSERLTKHLEYKKRYPKDAADTAQKKRRSLAINVGHRLTREQYFDALGEDDIPEPPVYPQHPNTRLFPNAANYLFPRSYADRLEGWARCDPTKANLENPLRCQKVLSIGTVTIRNAKCQKTRIVAVTLSRPLKVELLNIKPWGTEAGAPELGRRSWDFEAGTLELGH